MSAVGDFYIRACDAAGLDLDADTSMDRVAAAMDAVHEDPAYHSTVDALLSAVVAILRQAPRPCTRCTMTVSGLCDGNIVNGRTYCRECSGIITQTPTDRRERGAP